MPLSAIRSFAFCSQRGRNVEVQNYIDNTGVQVADVIVGLKYVEKKSLEDVRRMASRSFRQIRLLLLGCLCAGDSAFMKRKIPSTNFAAQTLKEIEEGDNETARMAEIVAMTIVRCHLQDDGAHQCATTTCCRAKAIFFI